MLFGCADKVLMKQHLHRYMDLPGKHAEALLADNKVKVCSFNSPQLAGTLRVCTP